MDKKELKGLTKALREEALTADVYYSYVCQFKKQDSARADAVTVSSSFYGYTRKAMKHTLFMYLARLYDTHDSTYNLDMYLTEVMRHANEFPEYLSESVMRQPNPWFVGDSSMYDGQARMPNAKCISGSISVKTRLHMYRTLYDQMAPILKRLREQRNCVYAHNSDVFLGTKAEFLSVNKLTQHEISLLLDYGMSLTAFVMYLYDMEDSKGRVQIDDWKKTLDYVQFGVSCQNMIRGQAGGSA